MPMTRDLPGDFFTGEATRFTGFLRLFWLLLEAALLLRFPLTAFLSTVVLDWLRFWARTFFFSASLDTVLFTGALALDFDELFFSDVVLVAGAVPIVRPRVKF